MPYLLLLIFVAVMGLLFLFAAKTGLLYRRGPEGITFVLIVSMVCLIFLLVFYFFQMKETGKKTESKPEELPMEATTEAPEQYTTSTEKIVKKKTVLSVPKSIQNIGDEIATLTGNKYICLSGKDSENVELAIIPWMNYWIEEYWYDYDAKDLKQENKADHIRVFWDANTLQYTIKADGKNYEVRYEYYDSAKACAKACKPAAEYILATEDEEFHYYPDENSSNVYFWQKRPGGMFAIQCNSLPDSERILSMREKIFFISGDFENVNAAGPQAPREIIYQDADLIINASHTMGLGNWLPDSLNELGVQNNYRVKMKFVTDQLEGREELLQKRLLESANNFNGPKETKSYIKQGSIVEAGEKINYYYGGIYQSGDTDNKHFMCHAYLDVGGKVSLKWIIKVDGIEGMSDEDMEALVRKCCAIN